MKLEKGLKEEVSIVENVNQEKISKLVRVGRIRPKKNHILFEVNLEEKTVIRAVFEDLEDLELSGGDVRNVKNRRIIINKGCLYISAMNRKNAIRKINKSIPKELHLK